MTTASFRDLGFFLAYNWLLLCIFQDVLQQYVVLQPPDITIICRQAETGEGLPNTLDHLVICVSVMVSIVVVQNCETTTVLSVSSIVVVMFTTPS